MHTWNSKHDRYVKKKPIPIRLVRSGSGFSIMAARDQHETAALEHEDEEQEPGIQETDEIAAEVMESPAVLLENFELEIQEQQAGQTEETSYPIVTPQYYVYSDDALLGPFTQKEVRCFWAGGRFDGEDLVCLAGTEDWQSIKTLLSTVPPVM